MIVNGMRKDRESYKKNLFSLDGSEVSEAVLPEIEKMTNALEASISLLWIVDTSTIFGHACPLYGNSLDRREVQVAATGEVEEYYRETEQCLRQGVVAESHVRYGDLGEGVLDCAARKDIALIAMCTHGRSGVERWLVGSVAEKLLRHASKPVLLVRCTG